MFENCFQYCTFLNSCISNHFSYICAFQCFRGDQSIVSFRNVLDFQVDYCFYVLTSHLGLANPFFYLDNLRQDYWFILLYIGIPVWMRVLQHMDCKITDTKQTLPSMSGWFGPLLIKVWTALSFILENSASLLFPVLLQGCFRNPWEGSKLTWQSKCGFILHQIYVPFILLKVTNV